MNGYVIIVNAQARYWRIKSPNGETVAHSETYASAWNARRAARRLAKLTGWAMEER